MSFSQERQRNGKTYQALQPCHIALAESLCIWPCFRLGARGAVSCIFKSPPTLTPGLIVWTQEFFSLLTPLQKIFISQGREVTYTKLSWTDNPLMFHTPIPPPGFLSVVWTVSLGASRVLTNQQFGVNRL